MKIFSQVHWGHAMIDIALKYTFLQFASNWLFSDT